MKDFYYNLKAFLKNLPLFLRLAWSWRKWDAQHTVDVLVILVKEHAIDCKNDKWHANTEVRYRQAMRAAAQLERAYGYYKYPALNFLYKKYPFVKTKTPEGYTCWKHDYKGKDALIEKMFKLAMDKESKIEEERKKEAWEYLGKVIERFWS